MIVSFANDFGLATFDHAFNLGDKLRPPLLGLVEPGAGDTEGNFEARVLNHVALEQIEHGFITFFGDFFENAFIALPAIVAIGEVIGAIGYVKNRVLPVTDRLMDM